jgi:hypothetical protein
MCVGLAGCGVALWFLITGKCDESTALIGLCVSFGLTVVAIGWGLYLSSADEDRLMAQCKADGRKEYECSAMLRSRSPTLVPMPIVVPSGR